MITLYNPPVVGEEEQVDAGHSDLQVMPVGQKVGQQQDEEETHTPKETDEDTGKNPLVWPH